MWKGLSQERATLFTQQYNGQAVKSAQAFAHAQRARDARLLEHAWQRAAPNTTHGIDCFASRQANSHKTCANSSDTLFAMKYLWHTVDYHGVLSPSWWADVWGYPADVLSVASPTTHSFACRAYAGHVQKDSCLFATKASHAATISRLSNQSSR